MNRGVLVDSFLLVFIMLFLIVLSNLSARVIPAISLPLHQIFLGVILGFFPISQAFHLETEMFMLLFVAPLLFMDGKHTHNRELWECKVPILLLALGLVFSTTMIVGPFISWLIPGLPLAASFALAAILSPTDAVSVKAISSKIKIPHNIRTIIEGESLLNDASGLVAFKFALVAQLTGVFSLRAAGTDFLILSLGGILVGISFVYAVSFVTRKLSSFGVDDANVVALIQIITPFAVFLTAEHFNFSGVLAVVSAGILASVNRARIITVREAHIRFVADGAWSSLLFVLNGLVFILLGMQLPLIAGARVAGDAILFDIVIVFAIYSLIMFIRFVWVMLLHGGNSGERFKNALLITLSGVKGAITLAACFSIPLAITLADGTQAPFFERDLILFISGGVIIVSILVASIILPLIFPHEAGKKDTMELAARSKLLKSAVDQISSDMTKENRHAAGLLLTYYEGLTRQRAYDPAAKRTRHIRRNEMAPFKAGLLAERNELSRLLALENSGYDKNALRNIKQVVEYTLARLEKKLIFESAYLHLHLIYDKIGNVDHNELARIKIHTTDIAINEISKLTTPANADACLDATAHFRYKLDAFLNTYSCETSSKYNAEIRELARKARQTERTLLNNLYRQGEIDNATRVRLMLEIELEEVAQLEEEANI